MKAPMAMRRCTTNIPDDPPKPRLETNPKEQKRRQTIGPTPGWFIRCTRNLLPAKHPFDQQSICWKELLCPFVCQPAYRTIRQ